MVSTHDQARCLDTGLARKGRRMRHIRTPEPLPKDTPERHPPMTVPDPILLRIEDFDRQNGSGASVCKSRHGYTHTLTAAQAPVARLKPEGHGDRMRLYYRS